MLSKSSAARERICRRVLSRVNALAVIYQAGREIDRAKIEGEKHQLRLTVKFIRFYNIHTKSYSARARTLAKSFYSRAAVTQSRH